MSRQCHLSPTHWGRLDTYWGTFDIVRAMSFVPDTLRRLDPYCWTFDIVQAMSFVPDTLGEARPLLGDIRHCPGNVICPRHTGGG